MLLLSGILVAMRRGKHLLLLAVLPLLVRCQNPQVHISPKLKQVFIGDTFYLKCSPNESSVIWYMNDKEIGNKKTLKIKVAAPKDSGSYQCETNGKKSDTFNISVLAFLPSASLTIESGHSVMHTSGSVILKLEHEDGLTGWRCWVYRGGSKRHMVQLKVKNGESISISFQTTDLTVPETIYWCTNRTEGCRSNQITLRTSDKNVLLAMDPLPVVVGESLTLRCVTWTQAQISYTVFYKNGSKMTGDENSAYEIPKVTESAEGTYKCDARFTYNGHQPETVLSDPQDVPVQMRPIAAKLSSDMSCSCPSCPPDGMSYRYYKKNGKSWKMLRSDEKPDNSGTYRCRAVWSNMRTLSSASDDHGDSSINVMVVVLLLLLLLFIGGIVGIRVYKKRKTRRQIYEDVALRSREQGDDKYEPLQKASGREREYDTLHPGAAGKETREGEYEPLKKEEMKEGVYNTLGTEGAAGGEGGYEALKKEGMKEGVYHTLGMEGAAGGEGGYEALKKEGMKEGVYHTLGTEGAAGGEGGYEALKKAGMKEGVYHTLGTGEQQIGEGGYEAVGKKD